MVHECSYGWKYQRNKCKPSQQQEVFDNRKQCVFRVLNQFCGIGMIRILTLLRKNKNNYYYYTTDFFIVRQVL